MKKLLFLLMLVTVAATAAIAGNGDDRNNGDKPDKGAKARSANANRLEEFIWTLPQSKVEKVDECEMQNAMVNLYKWYLQNETSINSNAVLQGEDQDAVVAPFKVDPKVLQQYLQFIKKNFPGLNEDDLTDKRAVSANKKKSAPVSYRDDLDAPISVSAPR